MKTFFLQTISGGLTVAFISAIFSFQVFAAGSGGGGSPPPPPDPAPSPPAEAPPVILEGPPGLPPCTQDVWSCDDWGTCQEDGTHARTCTRTLDCSGVEMPKPTEQETCPGLVCGHLSTLPERVTCRLELSDEDIAREFRILYFPEYCKVEETPEEKQGCIELYRSFAPCWELAVGRDRLSCARKAIGMKPVATEKAKCAARKSKNAKKACERSLNEKLEEYTLFQMYEYEVRAEDLLEQDRLTLGAVAAFDVFVEETKQAVEHAEDPTAWKKMLKDVKARYQSLTR